MDSHGEVTSLLAAWGKGDQNALNELMPLVYNELHRMARRAWIGQDQGNTLQPTALLNEAYLKLAGAGNASFQNRCHFFAVASTAMRQILVNHALSRLAGKRGSGQIKLSIDDVQVAVIRRRPKSWHSMKHSSVCRRWTRARAGLSRCATLAA